MSGLNRSLGIPMLTFYGTGMILGAGIYSVIGKAAAVTGDSLWIGFLLAGVAALLTAFSYAELSTMFPQAGAEFTYLSHAFEKKKWLAETAGIAMAFSGSATAATVAIAFTGYLDQFVESPKIFVAIALLVLFTGVSVYGVVVSGWTNIIFTLIEVFGLILLIYYGVNSEKFGDALTAMPTMATLSGAALIVFSYFGFENIVSLAEESKKPEKQLPWAIFISLGVSTILYVLVSLASLALMSAEALGESDAALMKAIENSSQSAAKILGGVALFSTANTALISMVGASRILYGMSKERALPSVMSRVLSQRKTPWIASLAILAVALLLLSLSDVETVAGISSLATMFVFLCVNIAVIVLRHRDDQKERAFKIPLNVGKTPVLAALGVAICAIFLFQFEAIIYQVGIPVLVCTCLGFYLRDKMKMLSRS